MPAPHQTQCLVKPGIDIPFEREQLMVSYVTALIERTKVEMGITATGSYERDSWVFKRAVAMRRWENDFSDRLGDPIANIWRISNRSYNQPQVAIEQHLARLSQSYEAERFFVLTPDDDEDEHPGMKLAERMLQERADEHCLSEKIVDHDVKGCLIRGEAVAKIAPIVGVKRELREVRVVVNPDGSPAKDSLGFPVTELDTWVSVPNNPAQECLARDAAVVKAAGAEVLLSERKVTEWVQVEDNAGAQWDYPFWMDLLISINAPTLDHAECKAHRFERRFDELLELLPSSLIIKENLNAYEAMTCQPGALNFQSRPEMAQNAIHRGELELAGEDMLTRPEGTLPFVQYAEVWFHFDVSGRHFREPMVMMIDLDHDRPIYYARASEVLRSKVRTHPFMATRIYPVDGRWYGRGYYDQYKDLSESVDADLNRTEIEKAKSGNLIFENRQATAQGLAGRPLMFRAPGTMKLVGTYRADDAVSVVTVSPQLQAIESSMDRTLATLAARSGGVTPGETEGADLQAANTATGLQILQETKNDQAELRAKEISKGVRAKLMVWAELELRFPNKEFIADLFRDGVVNVPMEPEAMPPAPDPDPMAQPMPPAEGGVDVFPPGAIPPPAPAMQPPTTIEKRKVDVLDDFLSMLKPEKLAAAVQIDVSRSRGGELLMQNDNILKILNTWDAYVQQMTMMPDWQTNPDGVLSRMRKRRSIFAQMLKMLDVTEPENLLDLPEPPPPMMAPAIDPASNPMPDAGGAPPPMPGPGGDAAPPPMPEPTAPIERAPIPSGRPQPKPPAELSSEPAL